MATSPLPTSPPVNPAQRGRGRPRTGQGFHWWYPAIIDAMIAHPEWTKAQIAQSLGVAAGTVYLVTNCDLFKLHFEKRREEFSRAQDAAVQSRLLRVANVALDRIVQTVESKPVGAIPLAQLTELSDKVLGRLGYGQAPLAAQTPVTVNIDQSTRVQATAQDLLEAREALRRNEELKLVDASALAPRVPHTPPSAAPPAPGVDTSSVGLADHPGARGREEETEEESKQRRLVLDSLEAL